MSHRHIEKTEEAWKQVLTPEQYHVTREKGTEAPGTGEYCHTKDPGSYHCSNCGERLFTSEHKYESGTGWPSFDAPAAEGSVDMVRDDSCGMQRMEVVCQRCGAHLGNVFDDGPETTGKRFCINSASLKLDKSASAEQP